MSIYCLSTWFLVGVAFMSGSPVGSDGDGGRTTKPNKKYWGTPVEGFRLSLRSGQKHYHAREPVSVQMVLQNADAQPREIVQRQPLALFTLLVTDSKGRDVPMTARGKNLVDAAYGGFRAIEELKPKEECTFDLDLAEVYDLAVPGQYRIVASLPVSNRKDATKFSRVTSNPLTLMIAPAKEKKDK